MLNQTGPSYFKDPLPCINKNNIRSHIGKIVIVHGKCNSIKGNTLTLITNTNPNEEVLISNFNRNFPENTNVKIIGKVNGDASIEFMDVFQLQDDFDLNLVNECINLMNHDNMAGMFI